MSINFFCICIAFAVYIFEMHCHSHFSFSISSIADKFSLVYPQFPEFLGFSTQKISHICLTRFLWQVDAVGNELKPVAIGTSSALQVGQSCFAIGNPYGYENTLTTGRDTLPQWKSAIRGAIQTDAAINAGYVSSTTAGNSGVPLINSYGHVIGVNTATFTRRGSGMSSGVNFAIPIDTALRVVPTLIVYGTPYANRY
ncbi:hypothetical protein SASPL_132591 [Salvia splendens]|uniref:Serine protease n=1 Tax=Salvia splendens TaxID=180675 RepID=A0A8X8ZHA2_SALSN|nr:hypothetical protein SASPL_132591 [Salvia splendens]